MNMTRRSMMLTLSAIASPAAMLGGCGGGVGTGGTGDFSSSFTYGQITGFGSVIVNGVRFDDSEARVVDDRGGTRSRDDLRLGMTVSIDSGAVTDDSSGPQARASVVRFGSVLEAPVSSVDAGAGTFVALGQTVRVQATTVFDDSLGGGIAALAGTSVEVHGYLDVATQSIIATRVEGFTPAGEYKARGVVASVDAGARTLSVGGATFDFSSASDVPAGLAAGQQVTLVVRTTPDGAGRWVVIRFQAGSVSRPSRDHDDADVRGVVTAFTDVRNFVVNDTTVDASGAVFSDGTGFGLGSRVKVEGSYRSGVLVAREVEIDDGGGNNTDDRIDLRGAIESVDAAARTFRLRGTTVDYSGAVEFRRGSAADLAAGRQVRVKGTLSGDGRSVRADEIEFD